MTRVLVPVLFIGFLVGGVVALAALDGDDTEEAVVSERGDDGPGPVLAPERDAEDEGDEGRDFEVTEMSGPMLPPGDGRMYWGMFDEDAPGRDALDRIRQRVGDDPAIVAWYMSWEGEPSFPIGGALDLLERGTVPLVTWEPWEPNPQLEADPGLARERAEQPEYRLARIVAGDFDDYIESFAAEIAEYRGPVFLRTLHEMNGDWYPWGGMANDNTPEDYVAAWTHIHGIFEEAGATNVTWVWSVNHRSYPSVPENDVDHYWPGDEYVDWVALSAFNWGQGPGGPPTQWEAFEQSAGPMLDRLEDYGKPIMISEFASSERGGDKAAWIGDTFDLLLSRSVDAALWFDLEIPGVSDWRIESSDAARSAFREAVARPEVVGGSEDLQESGLR